MNKNFQVIFILAVLVLGLSACAGEEEPEVPVQNLEGNDGLVISFVEGGPPEEIYDYEGDDSYEIALDIENKGMHSIDCSKNCGVLRIFAANPLVKYDNKEEDYSDSSAFSIDNKLAVAGKTLYTPGEKISYVSDIDLGIGPVHGTSTASIFALACYSYKTKFSESVCADMSDPTVPDEDKACLPKKLIFKGQGAPVVITQVDQQRISGGIIFKVFLKNLGGGTVMDPSSYETVCSSSDGGAGANEEENIGRIIIEEAMFAGFDFIEGGDGEGECNRGNDIELKRSSNGNEEAFFYCIYKPNNPSEEAFTGSLNLVLSYAYQSTSSKDIRIVSINEPPEISEFNVPNEAKEDKPITISGKATDDQPFKTDPIELIEEDGESQKCGCENEGEGKICSFECNGKKAELSFSYNNQVEDKFEVFGTFDYVYRVRAKDSRGVYSRTKSSVVRISGNPIINLVKVSNGGSSIVVKALDDKEVDRIVLTGTKIVEKDFGDKTKEGIEKLGEGYGNILRSNPITSWYAGAGQTIVNLFGAAAGITISSLDGEKEVTCEPVEILKTCGAASCVRNFDLSSLVKGAYTIQAFGEESGGFSDVADTSTSDVADASTSDDSCGAAKTSGGKCFIPNSENEGEPSFCVILTVDEESGSETMKIYSVAGETGMIENMNELDEEVRSCNSNEVDADYICGYGYRCVNNKCIGN